MKQFCALVLALILLVPAMAMAAGAPPAKITLQQIAAGTLDGKISFYTDPAIQLSTDDYTATYFMSGELRDYSVNYAADSTFSGIETRFTPNGQVQDIIITSHESVSGPGAMWNFADGYWFGIVDPEAKRISALDQYNPYTLGADKSPFSMNVAMPDALPPMQLEEILKAYGYTGSFDLMEKALVDVPKMEMSYDNAAHQFVTDLGGRLQYNGEDVTVIINGRPAKYDSASGCYVRDYEEKFDFGFRFGPMDHYSAQLDSVALIYDNIISIVYTRGRACSITAIGPVYYNSYMDSYMSRGASINGERVLNAEYGKDGERDVYFVYGDNYNTQTAYDNYNRMVTHEYWDSSFCAWAYYREDNGDFVWEYSLSGGGADWKDDREPTDEVLRSLALTTNKAAYNVGKPVSSASALNDEMTGLPFIVDANNALSGTTVNVTSELIDEETTVFDITPVSGSTETQPDGSVTLYAPLPAGMTAAQAKEYGMTALHDGVVYSTADDTLTVTDAGAAMTVSSFSPYTVVWGEKAAEYAEKYPGASDSSVNDGKEDGSSPESGSGTESVPGAGIGPSDPVDSVAASTMPSTGDVSNLMLFFALLVSSAGAFIALRRRAHQ